MKPLRRDIDEDPKRLEKIARRIQKDGAFSVQGQDYARPKGDPSPLLTPWYNKRSISVGCERPFDELVCSPALTDTLVEGFTFLEPCYEYFKSFSGGAGDLLQPLGVLVDVPAHSGHGLGPGVPAPGRTVRGPCYFAILPG